MTKERLATFLTLGLLAALAVFLILYATPEGLGLSDDSIGYIAGARSILGGQGYREAWLASNGPVTHFPPGFSTVLAIVGLSGLDPLRGSRLVNALLYGANTFLLGLIGWRMTKSRIAGIALALLFLVNASMLRVHAVAMSEPLYIFFTLVAFLTFEQYFSSAINVSWIRGKGWLVITGILTGLAYLTRYAGLALVATFLVAIVILHATWRERLSNAGIFLAGFLPWAIGWGIRNKLVADTATNRILIFHPLTADNLQIGIYNLSEFLVPVETWRQVLIKIPNLFVIILALIALILLIWVTYQGLKKFFQPATEQPEVLSFTNGLYVFGYTASIVSSMLLFDASTKFKLRINAPVYVSLLVLLVLLGHWLWTRRALLWRGLVILLAILIFGLSTYDMYGAVAQLHKGGQGYASFQWYDSEAMAFLRKLPEGTRIYTNQPGPVYLYTGRPSYVLPDLIDPVTDLPRENYALGVQLLHKDVLSGKAVLALFKFGSESEDVQSVYLQLADGLYLGHDSHGDKIYTAPPK